MQGMSIEERFERARLVRDMYPLFVDFCRDAMEYLGFSTTWMQEDIANFMSLTPGNIMVAAQRGEAKSTIACIYGVWCLTQDPTTRVMLVSASADKAEENATLMHGMIRHWDILQHLIPDKNAGDRTSVKAFDVHYALKGIDKSPSIACLGVTASLQGYRADLLIPDDVESTKNGLTATQRAHLLRLTQEFSAIIADSAARIVYLGTPQTKDSIYNTLTQRGYQVRVWPGRFPSDDLLERYGDTLAPSILQRMRLLGPECQTGGGLDGTLGWPTDPQRLNEQDLQDKELDYGPEGFQLQYMLNTDLSDAMRQQLRLRDLILYEGQHDNVPEQFLWSAEAAYRYELPRVFPVVGAEMYRAAASSPTFQPLTNRTLYIDPAGTGGDEVSFAGGGAVGPYIHLIAWGGFQGGLSPDNLDKLVDLCKEYNFTHVVVEQNMGAGTATQVIKNHFYSVVDGVKRLPGVGISERRVSGQKELRIIDTVRPVQQRHRLVMHISALEMDLACASVYNMQERDIRSGLYQMHNLTSDRGSLVRDDRIDALEGLVHTLSGHLIVDEERAERLRAEAVVKEFIKNPMGYAEIHTAPSTSANRPRVSRRRNSR